MPKPPREPLKKLEPYERLGVRSRFVGNMPSIKLDTLSRELENAHSYSPERTIPLIINNTHTNMYFKHFLVIKVLFTLFNEINNTSLFKPDTYIDIFPDMENNQLGIYFLIFNLYYKILDKYTEIFSYSD